MADRAPMTPEQLDQLRRDAHTLRTTNRGNHASGDRIEAFERLFKQLPQIIDELAAARQQTRATLVAQGWVPPNEADKADLALRAWLAIAINDLREQLLDETPDRPNDCDAAGRHNCHRSAVEHVIAEVLRIVNEGPADGQADPREQASGDSEDLTAVIAQRVRELRTDRGWSAERLAEEMTERAGVEWQRMVVVKLETGRRQDVSVRELLALAHVFDVAPVHLLVPVDDDLAPYPVTPKIAVRRGRARAWIRGLFPLSSTDERRYFAQVPRDRRRTR